MSSRRLAHFSLHHPRLVIALMAALTLLSAWLAFPPTVEGDFIKLLPPDDPAAQALGELRASPGGEGAALIQLPEGTDLDAMAERLQSLDTVQIAFWTVDRALTRKLALFQLEPAQIRDLAHRVRGALLVPSPMVQSRLLAGVQDQFPDPPMLLPPDTVIVIPTQPGTDAEFSVRLLQDLETAAPDALWMAGPHLSMARSVRGIRQDLPRTSLLSLVLVCLVAGFSFSDPRAVLVVLAPLLPAVVISMAMVQVFIGYLDTFTSLAAAVLFGLGIDFGVHLVARYQEERHAGASPPDAVLRAWETTGPPCTTAALTSAAAFLALYAAEFRALRHLGFVLASGVIVCLAAALVLLPILLVRLDPKGRPHAPTGRTWRLRLVLPLGLLVTAVLGWEAFDLHVESDLGALRREGWAWSELGAEHRGFREDSYPPVVVPTDNLRQEQARLQALVEAGSLPHVRGVVSIASVIPEHPEQASEAMAELIAVARDPRAASIGGPLQPILADLRDMDASPPTQDDLPAGLARMLGAVGPGDDRVLLLLQGNLQDLREARALHQELDGVVQGGASEFLAVAGLMDVFDRDLPRVSAIALFTVAIIALADLRSLRLAAIAVGGLIVGLTWSAGGLAALGIPINIANVVGLPIMLGIGVDVVIHLLHRLEAEGSVRRALDTTGRAALVSVLTSVVAFASLQIAGNRGVRSIGQVVVVGLIAVFLAGVTVVPAVWARTRRPGSGV